MITACDSFAKEPYKRDDILQKRPIIWIRAYPHDHRLWRMRICYMTHPRIHMCNMTHCLWLTLMCNRTHELIHMCDMITACAAFACATWPIDARVCVCVCVCVCAFPGATWLTACDSLPCATWHINSLICATWLTLMRRGTHLYARGIHSEYRLFYRALLQKRPMITVHIYMCDMTHCVWLTLMCTAPWLIAAFRCATWLTACNSFWCATWLINSLICATCLTACDSL